MYHAQLANRYLRSRIIPLIAVAAVALCVALVIIVVSVMTGFLDMLKSSGRTLMGDVTVSVPVRGIPHYERLRQRILELPEAAAATPIIETYGLLRMPYPDSDEKEIVTVQVWAVDPETFSGVTGFDETLYWGDATPEAEARSRAAAEALLHELELDADFAAQRAVAFQERADLAASVARTPAARDAAAAAAQDAALAAETAQRTRARLEAAQAAASRLDPAGLGRAGRLLTDTVTGEPGIVPGMHVAIVNRRRQDGSYQPVPARWWMPGQTVSLTLVPVSGRGRISEPKEVILPVVNEFFTGVYQVDKQRVFIPLREAQEMLRMSEATLVDPQDLDEEGRPRVIGVDPAKATKILVRAAAGTTPEQLRDAVAQAYEAFERELRHDPAAVVKPPPLPYVSVLTWEQLLRDLIGPVEKEREMMRILFSIIYLVCAGLVLSIFWSIVHEKTRDIGILRSIGAPRSGIVWIFLRYGLVIGVVGSFAGLLLAWLVVDNINAIHAAIGRDAPAWSWIGAFVAGGVAAVAATVSALRQRLLHTLLWSLGTAIAVIVGVGLRVHEGTLIWDPSVYYFSRIPSDVDKFTAVVTMIGAVVFSVLGASIPAAKAADTDPVKALRYE